MSHGCNPAGHLIIYVHEINRSQLCSLCIRCSWSTLATGWKAEEVHTKGGTLWWGACAQPCGCWKQAQPFLLGCYC